MGVRLPLQVGQRDVSFTVEVATTNHDLSKVATIVNCAYKKVRYLQDGIERITVSELAEAISNPQKKLYLCFSPAREICGTILVDFFEQDRAEIALFAIHPNYQGGRIGPVFMNHVEQVAFEKVSLLILKVIPLFQENLIKFYERLGYKMTGETMNFPEGDMCRYIRPECRDRIFFSLMQKNRAHIHSAL